jgi:2-aminoethylphosphonate-pyruvate transaminase
MIHDWGSRDARFLALNREVMERLPEIVHGGDSFVTVPMQGSGTFAVEAMLTTFVPRDGGTLLLINGAYGQRAKRILEIAGRKVVAYETPEDTPPNPAEVERILKAAPAITHVFMVHCETTSGILNPVAAVAKVAARHGKRLLIDAMSAFGALPLDSREIRFDAVAASSNKCLEGVPGLGYVVCRREAIAETKGNATTLTLDLYDQHQNFLKTGQFRFTPPIHVIAAFHRALEEFWTEGGVSGRGGRYRDNARILIEGMRSLGFETLLPDALQAPIIITFHMPRNPKFVFQRFYDDLKERGFVIYPGKLTVADSFRIGCIGRLYPEHMRAALDAVRDVLRDMDVELAPSVAA